MNFVDRQEKPSIERLLLDLLTWQTGYAGMFA